MKVFLSIILLAALSGLTTSLPRKYIYVDVKLDWFQAQEYCKKNYSDLPTFNNKEEFRRFLDRAEDLNSTGWIGLQKRAKDTDYVEWSDETPVTYTELDNLTATEQYDQCVTVNNEKWSVLSCNEYQVFFCYEVPDLILVEEKKTWEEALEYCRDNYTNLVSLISESDLAIAKDEVSDSLTDSIWTGLRFLSGSWFWVNGEPLLNFVSLSSCPASPSYCGARNFTDDRWEFRNCDEKRRFFCYDKDD